MNDGRWTMDESYLLSCWIVCLDTSSTSVSNDIRGNHRVRILSCYSQLVVMMFAQLTFRESLRDIVTCLGAMKSKLYHAGIRGDIAKSTLADANESRD